MENLIKRIGFPEEAAAQALEIDSRVKNNPKVLSLYEALVVDYLAKGMESDHEKRLSEMADVLGVHVYALHMVFLLECALRIKSEYDKRGISEEVYYDTMEDITFKIVECKKFHGFYGVFPFSWYHAIFGVYTFKLGRLEYAIGELQYDSYRDYAKRGDRVYNCHIPSCGPLTYELVIDSLKRAYKFFGCRDYLIVHCGSWMLYPPAYREVFPEGSNLRMFYELFDILGENPVTTNAANIWRVFYRDEFTPYDELPTDTTLQRNFVKFFKAGNFMGTGKGILVFDGEKIVNK